MIFEIPEYLTESRGPREVGLPTNTKKNYSGKP